MTPVIIAQPCALNAKEDYSRCHVMDYGRFMYVRVSIFSCHLCGNATGYHFNLICVPVCCLCALWSASAWPQKQTRGSLWCFSFPSPEALADSHSIAGWGGGGGRDEPQLLSDVNAAQTLCLCGHSPSDSSNQLMGYLTLPSTPLRLASVLLNLVIDVIVKSEQMLRAL